MRAALWPDAGIEALRAEALAWDASRGIALLAFDHEGRAIGMIHITDLLKQGVM